MSNQSKKFHWELPFVLHTKDAQTKSKQIQDRVYLSVKQAAMCHIRKQNISKQIIPN